jgi:signal peptidase I
MMPTFNPRGDIVLVDHISVTTGLINVGDVVIARSVQNPRHVVCKRVLGMEGDYVEVVPPIKAGSNRRIKVRAERKKKIINVFNPRTLIEISYCPNFYLRTKLAPFQYFSSRYRRVMYGYKVIITTTLLTLGIMGQFHMQCFEGGWWLKCGRLGRLVG